MVRSKHMFTSAIFASALLASGLRNEVNPVTRVVKLLEEMKAQVEAEAKEDEKIFDNHACWCETNKKEKTEAVKVAEKRIEDLSAAIEEGTARSAQLETEIAGLKDEIAENEESIDKATQMREKEREEFEAESQDSKEAIGALREAVAVLSKVQLTQKQASPTATSNAMLIQVRNLVSGTKLLKSSESGVYKSVLQRDLWDMLGSLPDRSGRMVTGLVEAQQPTGNAAGAKSYNAQSSQILGLLSEMMEEFERDLKASQKAEFSAEVSFQKLKASKTGEILAAGQSLEEKSASLADTNQRVAQAKEDLEDTREALAADQKFLLGLDKRCATADEDYAARKKTRSDEILAISETIRILTEDESRDLFSKSLSLLQVARRNTLVSGSAQRSDAVAQLLQTAHKYSGTSGAWQLATLAVSTQLDGFEKVKEMMDKMIAELKKQQQEEVEKSDACKKDIDANEDQTRVKNSEKKDLVAQITDFEATIKQLTQDLEDLKGEISDMHVSLKRASEDRKAQNTEFQQVVADQRATVAILHKALDRLRQFYAPKLLLQRAVNRHVQRQEPGASVPPPPATGKEYGKSGGAGGVMSTIEMIIQDAEQADAEAVRAEQEAQAAYAEMVANTNSMLDAAEKAVTEKSAAKAKAEGNKITAEKDLKVTVDTLEDLHGVNVALHSNCDYVLKNFNIRQQARQDEIDSIQEAKAILSGADFGF